MREISSANLNEGVDVDAIVEVYPEYSQEWADDAANWVDEAKVIMIRNCTNENVVECANMCGAQGEAGGLYMLEVKGILGRRRRPWRTR